MASTGASLFPPEHESTRIRLLPACATGPIRQFELEDLAPYRRLRILTYSASPLILRTLFARHPEQRIECVIGSAKVIGNLAGTFAHQAAVAQAVRTAGTRLDEDERDALRQRITDGQLELRVVRGHVAHTMLFLATEGADAPDMALAGSANLSAMALLGHQDELLFSFEDAEALQALEAEYERIGPSRPRGASSGPSAETCRGSRRYSCSRRRPPGHGSPVRTAG